MAFRTWIIRLVTLAVLAAGGAGVWWAQSVVSPDAVRDGLVTALGDQFADVDVRVGAARMRVFGGISVTDLALTRKGDDTPFFAAPAAVIYHDKEQINSGRWVIRKIEVDGPTLRLDRRADGSWNLAGLVADTPADKQLPTFVVTNGTVVITTPGRPAVTLTDARLTLMNDPRPVLVADGQATVRVRPPGGAEVTARGTVQVRVNRSTGQIHLTGEVPPLPLTPDLAEMAAGLFPPAADIKRLTGKVGVKADVKLRPNAEPSYDIRGTLTDGRFTDPRLPSPVEKLTVSARFADGVLTVESATAACGPATLEATLRTRNPTPPPPADPVEAIEHQLDAASVTVRDLPVSAELMSKLPKSADKARELFDVSGPVHISYTLSRPAAGGWVRQIDLRPHRMRVVYDKFRYPLDEVGGLLRKTVTSKGGHDLAVDLVGTAAGQKVTVKGTITGDGIDPGIALKVAGTNIPVDDALLNAIPNPKVRDALRQLRASGRCDFVADVLQAKDVNRCDSTFRIAVADGRVNYARFPYPLDRVRGKVTVAICVTDPTRPVDRPIPADRIELRDFEGKHGSGTVTLFGVNDPVPDSLDRRLTLHLWGKDCPMDADLRSALGELKLEPVWKTFSPRGLVTFGVQVTIRDRTAVDLPPDPGPRADRRRPAAELMKRKRIDPPFDPATDLTMALNFRGPGVTPDFFPVPLDDLAGQVWYDGARVKLAQFRARRGLEDWTLAGGEVRFYPDGRVYADVGGIGVTPFTFDPAVRAALPGKLKGAVDELNLRGPAELVVERLVALTPPDAPRTLPTLTVVARGQAAESDTPERPPTTVGGNSSPDPDLYWRGELRLRGASATLGVDLDDLTGRFASEGRYLGTHLGEVSGQLWLDRATVAGTPVERISAAMRTLPQLPDPLKPGEYQPPVVSVPDLTGTLFGGVVGGEARVVLAEPVRYTLSLTATDVRLEEVARYHNLGNGTKLAGLAQGRIELAAEPDAKTGKAVVTGGGSADVLNGHILNLKWLLPLLKTLKLQAPDKTAFEEAHATFTVRGDTVTVTHIDLLGNAISLGGSGEVSLDGERVKFELYTIWSQTLQRWLTTPLGDVTAFVSEKLFKIEVTRADGEMKYEPRVVPFVTDPFRAVAERMKRTPTARAAPK